MPVALHATCTRSRHAHTICARLLGRGKNGKKSHESLIGLIYITKPISDSWE